MKVKVTKDEVLIYECSPINEGEVMVNKCEFLLPKCFEGLKVTAAFNNIPVPLIDSSCYIPSLKKGTASLGVYAYRENENSVELMYSPKPTSFFVNRGSFNEEIGTENPPEISEYEKYCNYVKDAAVLKKQVENTLNQDLTEPENKLYSAKVINEIEKLIPKNAADNDYVANTVKNTVTNLSTLTIDDASPISSRVKVNVQGPRPDIPKSKVYKIGKNYLTFNNRVEKELVKDQYNRYRLDGDGLYLGVDYNGMVDKSKVHIVSRDTSKDEITVKFDDTLHGIALDFPVVESENYVISYSTDLALDNPCVRFYNESGIDIDFYGTVVNRNTFKIVKDRGINKVLITFKSKIPGATMTLTGFQFERSSYVTDYEPYVVYEIGTISSGGNIEGITLNHPKTNLVIYNARTKIICTYNKDLNKIISELKNAIISLGGNI